jgi:uncharacterized protein YeaO (DUF488 family)
MAIQVKRAYEKPSRGDGCRVLVDRIWPRGLSKADLKIDRWLKTIAPSTELRRWFGHDPDKWEEFKRRYFQELKSHGEELEPLREKARHGSLTLVFSAKDERCNNAVALREYLQRR